MPITIEFIVNKSESNDVVILAGKGHETYQPEISQADVQGPV